jgi:hypothetical protein
MASTSTPILSRRAMRHVTRAEAKGWTKLAREYGFVIKGRHVPLGRFVPVVSRTDNELVVIQLLTITPIIANPYSGAWLTKKRPPIMFDRNAAGEISIPGRWWHAMFERLCEDETHDVPVEVKAQARAAAHAIHLPDVVLPADHDTIEIYAPDDSGDLVSFEALPPGGRITMKIPVAS